MSLIPNDLARLSLDGEDVAGLTDRRFSLRRSLADRAHQGSDGWSEASSLENPIGAELSAQGLLVSNAALAAVRSAFLAGEARLWAFVLPGDGVWSGAFVLRSLDFSGKAEDLLSFSIRMVSDGPLSFTAES